MKKYILYDINGRDYTILAEKMEIREQDTIVFLTHEEFVAIAYLYNIIIVLVNEEN